MKWKGYALEDRTWESFEMFAYDAPDIVQRYLCRVMNKDMAG